MSLGNGLRRCQLREIEIEALRDRLPPAEQVAQMAETLVTLLDEAERAGEEHGDIDQLVGTIERLETQRASAVSELDEVGSEHNQATELLKQEHARAMADLANAADEYRARAEKAEYELAELRAKIEAMPLPSRRAVAARRKRKEGEV